MHTDKCTETNREVYYGIQIYTETNTDALRDAKTSLVSSGDIFGLAIKVCKTWWKVIGQSHVARSLSKTIA